MSCPQTPGVVHVGCCPPPGDNFRGVSFNRMYFRGDDLLGGEETVEQSRQRIDAMASETFARCEAFNLEQVPWGEFWFFYEPLSPEFPFTSQGEVFSIGAARGSGLNTGVWHVAGIFSKNVGGFIRPTISVGESTTSKLQTSRIRRQTGCCYISDFENSNKVLRCLDAGIACHEQIVKVPLFFDFSAALQSGRIETYSSAYMLDVNSEFEIDLPPPSCCNFQQ